MAAAAAAPPPASNSRLDLSAAPDLRDRGRPRARRSAATRNAESSPWRCRWESPGAKLAPRRHAQAGLRQPGAEGIVAQLAPQRLARLHPHASGRRGRHLSQSPVRHRPLRPAPTPPPVLDGVSTAPNPPCAANACRRTLRNRAGALLAPAVHSSVQCNALRSPDYPRAGGRQSRI